jgi:glutamate/tyrosine decarboxylase-like PLP-dependent enzyme
MTSRLDQLRRDLARPLPHPDRAELEDFLQQTSRFIVEHWTSLREQGVGRSGGRAEMEALLREPLPESGQEFAPVLEEFRQRVAAYAFRVNHPRFFAFIPSAPSIFSVLGDILCAGTNFFSGVWLEASAPTQVEIVVLDWLKEMIGYPPQASGILTSGGSEANLTALVTAREHLSFPDRQRAMLYTSEQRHRSVDRAARIIGLRPDQVRTVPSREDWTLNLPALADQVVQDRAAGLLPWAVVANAGATSTGAVDPLAGLASLCRSESLWLHVDAAYGWPAVLLPEGRRLLAGIDQADSLTLDPHKWFAQTFEAGCLLVRNGPRLAETFALRPDYMQDVAPADDEVNFADHGIALTRRFRALKIWLSMKVLGIGWFRSLVERCCALAEFAELCLRQSSQFEVLSPRKLSIVCFRLVRGDHPGSLEELNRYNLEILDRLRATRRAFLSSTLLNDRVALRFCFVNWQTTAADVEEAIALLQEAAR